MKRLIYPQYTTPDGFKFETVPKPVLGAPNEVLVKIYAASINPIDVKRARGSLKFLFNNPMPSPIGFDFSGVVEEVGKDVTEFSYGDRVFATMTEEYRGTFQEFCVIPAEMLSKIPENMSFEDAAALSLAGQTALDALDMVIADKEEGAEWFKGKTVFIVAGLSSTGSTAAMLAKNVYGAEKVIITASSKKVPLVAEYLGEGVVDQVIDYKTEDPTKVIAPKSIDLVLATQDFGFQYLHLMKPGGEIVSLVAIPDVPLFLRPDSPFPSYFGPVVRLYSKIVEYRASRYQTTFHGAMSYSTKEKQDRLAKYAAEGKIHAVIAKVCNFSDQDAVLDMFTLVNAETGYTGKMVARIGQPFNVSVPRGFFYA
ncbi:chaperonin 10-like protein [Lipomyces oligophaga]|uniref:chaperonin 10-like protein n=1 Tax=Lipomyces oligophaga TaxID=45792 RepID=UPI0034CF9B58